MLYNRVLGGRFLGFPDIADVAKVLPQGKDRQLLDWVLDSTPVARDFRVPDVVECQLPPIPTEVALWHLQSLGVDPMEDCFVIWAGPEASIVLPGGLALRHFYEIWYHGFDDLWMFNKARTWVMECTHRGRLRFAWISDGQRV